MFALVGATPSTLLMGQVSVGDGQHMALEDGYVACKMNPMRAYARTSVPALKRLAAMLIFDHIFSPHKCPKVHDLSVGNGEDGIVVAMGGDGAFLVRGSSQRELGSEI